MADPVPAPEPTPTPTPSPETPTRTRGAVNKEHLKEIQDARDVAAAAVDPAHTARLTDMEMDATLPGKINILADKLDVALGTLVGTRAGKEGMTDEERAARDALIEVIQPIQTAAVRKFTGEQAATRKAYYIGAKPALTNQSLLQVVNAARAILKRLIPGENNTPPQDVLPGVKADGAILELSNAIAAYVAKDKGQGDLEEQAEGDLEAIVAQIKQLAGWRRDIQLAADQAWPWRKEGVRTVRKAFLLPMDKPFVV